MTDRILIPFGNRVLCLSQEAFQTAMREGEQTVREVVLDTGTAAQAGSLPGAIHLLNAADAARTLDVPSSWLLRQAREGRIHFVRIGKYVRFRADTIIEQCTRPVRCPATRARATTDASNQKPV